MHHTSKLRSRSGNGFKRRLFELAAALFVTLLLPLAASAYTVVLRDGRSVPVPDNFSVTRAGITYEYAPGLYVTIQMTSIDVAATERANGEGAGALLSRVGRPQRRVAESPRPASANGARRTLTDRELEGARQRREASEAAYDKRRRELGLPSLEETRQQREEELRRYNVMAAQADAEEAQAESYWRTRAEELRTALAVNEAEASYLRSKLQQSSYGYTFGDLTLGSFSSPSVWPAPFGFPGPAFPTTFPGAALQPRVRPPVREPLPGNRGLGRDWPRRPGNFNPRPSGFPGRRGFGRAGLGVLPFYAYPSYGYNFNDSYDRGALDTRLRELEAEHAGLRARWNRLEEEARRAGVPPGWLRP